MVINRYTMNTPLSIHDVWLPTTTTDKIRNGQPASVSTVNSGSGSV